MSRKTEFDVIFPCCAGLDVHKDSIQVCVRRSGPSGRVRTEDRQFGTFTKEILAMGAWLAQRGVKHVAMEATGVYWKPIWNLLEHDFDLWLCNAKSVKQVPGRKTDVKDAQWLAKLMQFGLLNRSFVADRPQRELRDLARQRVKAVNECTAVANRIEATLEDANIKLASVASDALGVSGREMIRALIDGETDAAVLADMAKRRLREKIPQLTDALECRLNDHHRFLLQTNLDHLEYLESKVTAYEARMDAILASEDLNQGTGTETAQPLPFPDAVELVDTHPGIDICGARTVLAETGTDMSRFPTHDHLAAWAGLAPGNNESAGKRRKSKTVAGNTWLRRILVQIAWAAVKKKDCYLRPLFRRIAARRGKKRAIIAAARSILTNLYHMLKNHEAYREIGPDYLDKVKPEALKRRLCNRLSNLGYDVQLTPKETAA